MQNNYFWTLFIAAIFAVLLLYSHMSRQPDQYKTENIQKSFWTLGLLALALILFLGFVVMGTQLIGENYV